MATESTQSTSIKPVIDAIDRVIERVRSVSLPKAREYERTRALNTLEAVKQILKVNCDAPSGPLSWWEEIGRNP